MDIKIDFTVFILYVPYIYFKEMLLNLVFLMLHSLFCKVVDMALALEAVSLLEKTPVTKEALEV